MFTQNETLVESILTEVVGAALWVNQTDGEGKGTAGFGYHAVVIRHPAAASGSAPAHAPASAW